MSVILLPARAVEEVCHEEQLRIWAHDHILGALAMEGYIREDLSYGDGVDMERIVMHEIKQIIESAFDHPAAMTIRRS
jgi:hypothetical protein